MEGYVILGAGREATLLKRDGSGYMLHVADLAWKEDCVSVELLNELLLRANGTFSKGKAHFIAFLVVLLLTMFAIGCGFAYMGEICG